MVNNSVIGQEGGPAAPCPPAYSPPPLVLLPVKRSPINSGRRNKFYIRLCVLLLFQARAHGTVDISGRVLVTKRSVDLSQSCSGRRWWTCLPPAEATSTVFLRAARPGHGLCLFLILRSVPPPPSHLFLLHPPVPLPLALFARNIKISTIPVVAAGQWRNYEFRSSRRFCFTTAYPTLRKSRRATPPPAPPLIDDDSEFVLVTSIERAGEILMTDSPVASEADLSQQWAKHERSQLFLLLNISPIRYRRKFPF